MRTRSVAPLNTPSEFRLEEMFFSTTDRKGVITSGNSVFVRVSGFSAAELIGEPHNIIRHPDMPRAVFRLLWRTLAAKEPLVALVKNMAKDGRYYWVVALVLPLAEGYLSIRFKPSSGLLAQVEPLYARMREVELQHGDGGGEAGRAGMDAAEKRLGETLQQLGHASYESFMWALMHAEMKSRDTTLGLRSHAAPATGPVTPGVARLLGIHEDGRRACAQIDRLYRRLDELLRFSAELAAKSSFVTDLTRDIRFVALSTSIKASRLGESGNSLGIIASFLSDSSARTSGDVQRLTGRIHDITAELRGVAFHLSAARLQIEMVLTFCAELLGATDSRRESGHSRARMITDLGAAFATTTARATRLLGSLGQHLHELNFEAEDLRKTMLMFQVAQVCGMVETSRIHADVSLTAIFDEVRRHVEKTSVELAELSDITTRFARLIQEVPEIEREIAAAVARIEQQVDGIDETGAAASPSEPSAKGAPVQAVAAEPALVAAR